MTKKHFAAVAVVFYLLLAAAVAVTPPARAIERSSDPTTPPAAGYTTAATITRVIDGDTIELEIRHRLKIRIIDCWAPETHRGTAAQREAGRASAANLARLIWLHADQKPAAAVLHIPTEHAGTVGEIFSFDRALGHVWAATDPAKPRTLESLAARQIADGHATATKRRPPKP